MIKTLLAAVVAAAFVISAPAFAHDEKAAAGDKTDKPVAKDTKKKKDEGKKEEAAKPATGGW